MFFHLTVTKHNLPFSVCLYCVGDEVQESLAGWLPLLLRGRNGGIRSGARGGRTITRRYGGSQGLEAPKVEEKREKELSLLRSGSGRKDARTREVESRDEGTRRNDRRRRRWVPVSSATTTTRGDVSVRLGIPASGVRTTSAAACASVGAAYVWKSSSSSRSVAARFFAIRSSRCGDLETASRSSARASLVWPRACSWTAEGPRLGWFVHLPLFVFWIRVFVIERMSSSSRNPFLKTSVSFWSLGFGKGVRSHATYRVFLSCHFYLQHMNSKGILHL
jgi:hypothetical protein